MSSAVIYPPGRGAGALEASPGWRHRRPPGRSRGLERPWLVRRVGRPRQIRGVRGFGPCPGHYVNGHMAPPKKLFGKSIKSVGHLGQVGSGGRSGGAGTWGLSWGAGTWGLSGSTDTSGGAWAGGQSSWGGMWRLSAWGEPGRSSVF